MRYFLILAALLATTAFQPAFLPKRSWEKIMDWICSRPYIAQQGLSRCKET
jgi:hypothetical protein